MDRPAAVFPYHMDQPEMHTVSREPGLHDEDGLPAESFIAFSEDPLDFEEMTLSLRKNLREVYELTGTLNRFSRSYPVCCRQMEQLIKRLGSCLVTKAALEYNGCGFPALQDMDIRELYCMVSFNFRKTDTAFREGREQGRCADMGLLEQQCRLADLAERLKSTEEKIRLIRAGKTDIEALLDRAGMYKGQKAPAGFGRKQDDVSGKAPSLPLITSVISQILRNRKAKEKRERELEKLLNDDPFAPKPFKPLSKKQLMEMLQSRKKDEKPKEKKAEPARPVKKDKSYISEAVAKMQTAGKNAPVSRDPQLDRIMDESMRRVFETHKRTMGGQEASRPGRA